MAKWVFDDPRGAVNVLEELFPDSSRKGLALIKALRKIDHKTRNLAKNSKRYGEEHMNNKMRELNADLLAVLGRDDVNALSVSLNLRTNSGTITMPAHFVDEKDWVHFAGLDTTLLLLV